MNEELKEWKDESTGEVYRISFSQLKMLKKTKTLLTIVSVLLVLILVGLILTYVKIDSLNFAKICYNCLK